MDIHPEEHLETKGYLAVKREQALKLLHKRIEIPVHYNAWMQGMRYGKVTSIAKDGEFIRFAPDIRPNRRIKIWRIDYEYVRLIDHPKGWGPTITS